MCVEYTCVLTYLLTYLYTSRMIVEREKILHVDAWKTLEQISRPFPTAADGYSRDCTGYCSLMVIYTRIFYAKNTCKNNFYFFYITYGHTSSLSRVKSQDDAV